MLCTLKCAMHCSHEIKLRLANECLTLVEPRIKRSGVSFAWEGSRTSSSSFPYFPGILNLCEVDRKKCANRATDSKRNFIVFSGVPVCKIEVCSINHQEKPHCWLSKRIEGEIRSTCLKDRNIFRTDEIQFWTNICARNTHDWHRILTATQLILTKTK